MLGGKTCRPGILNSSDRKISAEIILYQGIEKDTELFEGETALGSLFMNRVLSLNQLLQIVTDYFTL